jgi:hypothetical protein
VATLVVPVALLTSGCDDVNANLTIPASSRLTFAAEPATLVPRFIPDQLCHLSPPFLAFINLTFGSDFELFLERVRFNFLDKSGGQAIPTVTVIPSIHSSLPTSTLPIPSTFPIPTAPGIFTFGSAVVTAGHRRTDAFSLRFGCGVPADGTLFIIVDTTDGRGKRDHSRTSVRIGR